MARTTSKKNTAVVRFEPKCKICNSHFKDVIEEMYNNGLTVKQIWNALDSLQDPDERNIWLVESIKEANISRHLQKHYNIKVGAATKLAENRTRLEKSRAAFREGVHMKVNAVATLSHLIDIALINLEELDSFPDGRQRHQLTINYMTTIKNLVDEFSKLTGELKQEGSIDINFFSFQIAEFANIVMATIKKMDKQFGLNNQLEYEFGNEFQKQWRTYKDTQNKMINGELPLDYGERERNVNTFNDAEVQDLS